MIEKIIKEIGEEELINNVIDWYKFSREYAHQLSEEFIIEFKDYLDWVYISERGNITKRILEECKDKLRMDDLLCNERFRENLDLVLPILPRKVERMFFRSDIHLHFDCPADRWKIIEVVLDYLEKEVFKHSIDKPKEVWWIMKRGEKDFIGFDRNYEEIIVWKEE